MSEETNMSGSERFLPDLNAGEYGEKLPDIRHLFTPEENDALYGKLADMARCRREAQAESASLRLA
jgi:hypothetical protein